MISFIDGLRGLMAIWVFIYHAQFLAGSHEHIPPGTIAVDVFMFISGLLMAFNYRRREEFEPWNARSTWWSFYIRRLFRIAPLYYMFLAVAILFQDQFSVWHHDVQARFPSPWQTEYSSNVDPSLTNIVLHVSFLFGLLPQFSSNNLLPDWSLSLEMQFYAVFPMLMLLARRAGYGSVILLSTAIFVVTNILVGFSVVSGPHVLGMYPQPSILPGKLNCFLVGILAAEAYFWRAERGHLLLIATAVALGFFRQSAWFGGSVVLSIFLLFGQAYWVQFGWSRVMQLLSAMLSHRFVRHLGDISYGIYLSHMLVIVPASYVLVQSPSYVALPEIVRWVVLVGVSAIPIYSISLLGHVVIENPFISLSRRLTSVRRDRATLKTEA